MNRDREISLLICLTVFLLMSYTSRLLPLCWDEGEALFRADRIAQWFSGWETRGWSEQFSDETMTDQWRFVNYKEGHPAFYGVLAAGSKYGLSALWGPDSDWASPRTGFLLFYSAAVGAVFLRVRKIQPEEPLAAWFACFGLVFMPRLFALAHFSVNDSILISCWILAWTQFDPDESSDVDRYGACRRWLTPSLWGAFLGLACASKFTGFCAVPCFALAVWLRPNGGTVRYLLRGFVTAAVVFYLVNPVLWTHPIDGLIEFFRRNLGREETFNLTGYFFGRRYNMTYSLPFWNTIVWVLIAIPTGILVCLAFGLKRLWRDRRQSYALILAANAAVLLVVRALPHAPAHDNDRLFIVSFAFLAIIAGLGAGAVWRNRTFDRIWARVRMGIGSGIRAGFWLCRERLGSVCRRNEQQNSKKLSGARIAGGVRPSSRWATALVLLGIVFGAVSSWVVYAPSWLSYYNLLIGGLPGAYAVGMEPAYWWTDLDAQTLNWINQNTPAGEKVRFNPCSYYNMNILVRTGKLQRNYYPGLPGSTRWYVMQNRPSVFTTSDQVRLQTQRPVYVKAIPFAGWGPWNLQSVPLILIYPNDIAER